MNEKLLERITSHWHGQVKDWAFLKGGPFSDRQETLLRYMVEHKGEAGAYGCGIDFGGHTAYQGLVNGLRRKGVIKIVGTRIMLVEGDPIVVEEAKLVKPFIKVGRRLINVFDGDQIRPIQANVWLDTRGNAAFHIALPEEMAPVFKDDPRTAEVEGGIFTATAYSLEDVIARAQALSTEFVGFTEGEALEVLFVKYTCEDKERSSEWSMNGLMFSYEHLLLVDGNKLYRRLPNGGIEQFRRRHQLGGQYKSQEQKDSLIKHDQAVLIDYTPEREAILESIRLRLAMMASEFKRVVTEEDFAKMIDQHGHALLEMRA